MQKTICMQVGLRENNRKSIPHSRSVTFVITLDKFIVFEYNSLSSITLFGQLQAELAVSKFSGNGAGVMSAAGTIASTFVLVFVAEWGDKSFFLYNWYISLLHFINSQISICIINIDTIFLYLCSTCRSFIPSGCHCRITCWSCRCNIGKIGSDCDSLYLRQDYWCQIFPLQIALVRRNTH